MGTKKITISLEDAALYAMSLLAAGLVIANCLGYNTSVWETELGRSIAMKLLG